MATWNCPSDESSIFPKNGQQKTLENSVTLGPDLCGELLHALELVDKQLRHCMEQLKGLSLNKHVPRCHHCSMDAVQALCPDDEQSAVAEDAMGVAERPAGFGTFCDPTFATCDGCHTLTPLPKDSKWAATLHETFDQVPLEENSVQNDDSQKNDETFSDNPSLSNAPVQKKTKVRDSLIDIGLTEGQTVLSDLVEDEPGANIRFRWVLNIYNKLDYIMLPIIFANCFTIGFELESRLRSADSQVYVILDRLDDAFLTTYTLELFFRLYAVGFRQFVKDNWFLFDLTLVVSGVVTQWILRPLTDGWPSDLIVWKMLRLLRMLRAIRLLKRFDSIWRMIWGVISSLRFLCGAFILLFTALYVFACIGIEMISLDESVMGDPILQAMVDERFYSIPRAMLTLMSYITMDSLAAFYEPLVVAKPELIVYFVPIIMIISIATMNVVLGSLLENAIRSMESHKELYLTEKRKMFHKLQPIVSNLFDQLDTDSTGTVTMKEIHEADVQLPNEFRDKITIPTILDLFHSIDTDKNGTISKDEWTESLLFLAFHEGPSETTRILQLIRRQHKKFSKLEAALKALAAGLEHTSRRQEAALRTETHRQRRLLPVQQNAIDGVESTSLHNLGCDAEEPVTQL